ncbi:MAG: bifunctional riboflavin kinase/FAD synthetase [Clostridia bacterium]|nr:bifunctional riboflavin kinase/FAD synthetase [Clostridia bacterium]
MQIISLNSKKEITLGKSDTVSCTVGNFDGVHLGHAALIKKAAEKGDCTFSAVWTFIEHTRKDARLLTSFEQRADLFQAAGVDLVILEDFDRVKDMSPRQFVYGLLYEKCHVRRAVCGYDFHFGRGADGNADDFVKYFSSLGAQAQTVDPVRTDNGEIISSSLIRQAVEEGRMVDAEAMLGRRYSIRFPVCHGQHLASKLGVPTINQIFPENFALPLFGVYACLCVIDGIPYHAVSNVGVRPTVFDTAAHVNCETHIIGFDGDLYGKEITVEFVEFIRREKKFPSLDELSLAIRRDAETAEKLLSERGV